MCDNYQRDVAISHARSAMWLCTPISSPAIEQGVLQRCIPWRCFVFSLGQPFFRDTRVRTASCVTYPFQVKSSAPSIFHFLEFNIPIEVLPSLKRFCRSIGSRFRRIDRAKRVRLCDRGETFMCLFLL